MSQHWMQTGPDPHSQYIKSNITKIVTIIFIYTGTEMAKALVLVFVCSLDQVLHPFEHPSFTL